jgi:DNA-binding response OmpR family regulator
MSRSILVADFDMTRRYVIARVLRGAGYDVVEAADAERAEEALSTRHFALVFVAMHLAGGDGFDLCRSWSARGLRVVLISSEFRGSEPQRTRGRDSGAVALLSSSADRERVLELADQLLSTSTISG